jgi:hypothetical protein
MKTKRLLTWTLALASVALSLAAGPSAHAGQSYGENVPSLAVGQSWVTDATARFADIDELQIVFMFSSSVGNTYQITSMPYDATKPEDDTVFRKIENGAVIDDDGGQNNYSSTLWTRTNASNSTGNITNYGFSVKGFSTSLKNLRVVVTRLK